MQILWLFDKPYNLVDGIIISTFKDMLTFCGKGKFAVNELFRYMGIHNVYEFNQFKQMHDINQLIKCLVLENKERCL